VSPHGAARAVAEEQVVHWTAEYADRCAVAAVALECHRISQAGHPMPYHLRADEARGILAPRARLTEGWLAVYRVSQAYGGPEEGGWYYGCGELFACLPATRWSWSAECATDDGPQVSSGLLAECDGAEGEQGNRIPLADTAGAEAMIAACMARWGADCFRRRLSLVWRDSMPEAFYPASRPRYE
jgi:hypothetical protein